MKIMKRIKIFLKNFSFKMLKINPEQSLECHVNMCTERQKMIFEQMKKKAIERSGFPAEAFDRLERGVSYEEDKKNKNMNGGCNENTR